MFDNIEITINNKTISGFGAVIILVSPFIACILMGIMIGAQL